MKDGFESIWTFIGGIALVVIVFLLKGVLLMYLWNWIIPIVSNNTIPTLTFWQSIGVVLLTAILFRPNIINNKDGNNTSIGKAQKYL